MMSRDIRSFFKIKSTLEEKSQTVLQDEIIPESPGVHVTKKKKESKRRRVIDDSSDEEVFNKRSKLQTKADTVSKKSKRNDSKKTKSALKEVHAVDIFGTNPVKRTEPLIKKREKSVKTEIDIHSDEEFEKSLLQLDNTENFIEVDSSKNSSDDCEKSICVADNKLETLEKENGDTKSSSKLSPIKNEINKSHEQNYINQPVTKTLEEASTSTVFEQKNQKKHDFSEFIESTPNNTTIKQNHQNSLRNTETSNINRKRKLDKTLNESVLSDEERYERKRMSAVLYQNYLNRSGPKHLGAKEIPEGTPTCLKDCAFLLTGVLDSFERDEIIAAIKRFSGIIKSGVTRKVTHVLAGEEAGPAKLAKAQELGIPIINEDEFLKLIQERSKSGSINDKIKSEVKLEETQKIKTPTKTPSKTQSAERKQNKNDPNKATTKTEIVTPEKFNSFKEKIQKNFYAKNKDENRKINDKGKNPERKTSTISSDSSNEIPSIVEPTANGDEVTSQLMWVDKYKPQTLKQIIGQHGDNSNAKKLSNWLMRWYINRKEKIPKPSPWSKNDNGAYYKAALLSGPPGVGKTTTVSLVCKELGFDMVEFNASDTRNKTLIKQQITELLTTTSLSGYAKGDTSKKAVTKKHVLVMDEVDGMAGNEDRGGLQELISLIKITAVPIVCMCNDRNSQKMRTLVNYCYDLKFSRPRVDQIKSALLSVCFKEGVKVHPDALTQLILAANQDVRQTLNMLSLWSVNSKHLEYDQVKKDANNSKKDMKLGPWEAVRKVFTEEEQKKMTLNEKSDLFFYDYSLAPLFVQENYLQVVPHCPKKEILDRVSIAADSLSMGDLIEARIRSRGNWNLLPMQAMYSSVIPGHAISGHVAGQIQFPSWLGKNSRTNKLARLCQEIHAHTRLSTSGSKSSIFLDYAKHLRDAVVKPLMKDKTEGIPQSLEVLQSYHLLRDDLDSLTELATWPGQRDPLLLVDPKVKAAMTRTYNKEASALPYAPGSVKRGRGRPDTEEDFEDGIDQEDEVASDSDPENDALIKKKKKPSVKDKKDTEKPSTSKTEKGKKGKIKKS